MQAQDLIHTVTILIVMWWCTIWSVCNGAHLYPFLRLQKRGVCGRIRHRVMLMRRSNVCSRTCHRTQASALHLLETVEVIKGSWALRYSTAVSWEPRRSARCRMGGLAAAAHRRDNPASPVSLLFEVKSQMASVKSYIELKKRLPVWRIK